MITSDEFKTTLLALFNEEIILSDEEKEKCKQKVLAVNFDHEDHGTYVDWYLFVIDNDHRPMGNDFILRVSNITKKGELIELENQHLVFDRHGDENWIWIKGIVFECSQTLKKMKYKQTKHIQS